MSYLVPASYSGMSTWTAHTKRVPPSTEPGTDYYMPIGTPIVAATNAKVAIVGGSVSPATGRFIVLDDGTRWIRYLHLQRQDVRVGQTVTRGQQIGLSGASGYGSEFFGAKSPNDPGMLRRTGGPHVHVTAFKGRGYTFGLTGTVDFHALTGGGSAAGGGTTNPETTPNTIEDKDKNMEYLFQIDPQVDGRWVVANYREGTMRVVPNGFQLDLVRAEAADPKAPALYVLGGPQPPLAIAGLRAI